MCLCTYYNDYEIEKYKKVSDPDINDLLQAVRDIDPGYYITEEDYTEKGGWFTKPKTTKLYSILYHIRSTEYQVLNLCRDGLDIYPNDSIVAAYLIGFLNGNRKSIGVEKLESKS